MKRLLLCMVCVCALGSAFLTSGCGPGLVAAGGGGVGAIFGLQGGDDDDDGSPPPAPSTAVAPAVIVTSLTREESPAAIQYTIIDANADTCSIEVEYSTGGAFLPCFAGAGGDGQTGLSSSASGISHVFEWDFAADLGPSVTQGLSVRIRANDGGLTGSWSLLSGQTIGNEAPVPSAITPIGTDVVLISFNLADANSDLGSIEALYSIDQGQHFIPIDLTPGSPELIGNSPVNLLTSPGGAPAQFIWNSAQSLSDYVGDVLIQLVPKDQPAGYTGPTSGPGVISAPFLVDNSVNNAPELAILGTFDGLQFAGQVPVDITLQDTESDAAIVVVQYSVDGGQNFADATLVNQFAHGVAGPFLTSPSTTQFQIVWDALTDLGQINPYVNDYSDVMLLLIPLDSTVGTPRATGVFGLEGNTAPQVQSIGVYQVTGNIPVVINIKDDNSHPVSLDIQYSTDGFAFTTLTASDFAYGDPASCLSSPMGTDNVLVWDTFASIGAANHAGVILRVTPTDHPLPLVAAADETGATFDSAPFPVINDPSSNQPVSLDLFTTTAGGAPDTYVTVEASGQAYLDRVINPPNAAGFGTYWRVIGGSSFGTLQLPGGGALDYAIGEVEVAAPGSIVDGDTFVIDDGINGPRTFEFDDDTVVQLGHVPVFIGAAASQNDVAVALADAVNNATELLLTATVNAANVTFTHQVAARIGNASSVDVVLGNADDMAFSGAGTVIQQLQGGDSTGWVRFDAPATPPGGSTGVQIECAIDDPAYAKSVTNIIFLYWGNEPLSVDVQPLPASVLINDTLQLTADVLPAGAPQFVTWQIMAATGHGNISTTGLYTAPNKLPTINPVPIRASSVDSSVFMDFTVNIQPLPTQITVTPPADNPPTWIAPDLRLGASIQFTEDVTPAAAPQGVFWRIFWNNQEWGSGNSTVGQITAGGLYTAPSTLPSPTSVRIDAVSQVAPSIFGSYVVKLVAPPPTSFEVTPLTASVFAGGQGTQFNAVNFLPTNANTAVSWELNPVVGSIVNGFYTPPPSSLIVQVITVTARSVVAAGVTAQATVTVNPNVQIAPTGVDVSPASGATISAGQSTQTIQFNATVQPSGANQAVTWSFVGAQFGDISAAGLYTPGVTSIDRTVTLRCTADASPNPQRDVVVTITGNGADWLEVNQFVNGRGQASSVFDSFNNRIWFVGGNSETAPNNHDTTALWLDLTPANGQVGAYQAIDHSFSFGASPPNVIMAVKDTIANKLVAVVGQGTSRVRVFELDLTKVDPPTFPAEPWVEVAYGGAANAPILGGNTRYHVWWNHITSDINVLKGRSEVYRLDRTGGGGHNNWKTVASTGSQGQAPDDPLLPAHTVDFFNNKVVFVGAAGGTSGAGNRVWSMDLFNFTWTRLNNSGSAPGTPLEQPAAYVSSSGRLYVFGGNNIGAIGASDEAYEITFAGPTANWNPYTHSQERPLPRAGASLAVTSGGQAFLYGGYRTGTGVFGDLWEFNNNSGVFTPFNADLIQPQGRDYAAGAHSGSSGYTYGGVSDFGVNNDLWRFSFSTGQGRPEWTRIAAGGERPPQLWGAGGAWGAGGFLLFGGDSLLTGAVSALNNEVYQYSTSTGDWTRLTPSGTRPSARREAAVTYSQTQNRLWVYGGVNNLGALLSDLWYLDLSSGLPGTWVNVTYANAAPDGRRSATIGHDTEGNRLLVFGGFSQVSQGNAQVHAFHLPSSSWFSLNVGNTGAEENCFRSAGVWDNQFRRMIHTPPLSKKAQAVVITTNGPTWQYMLPAPSQNHATAATGLYDPATGRYYALFGNKTVGGRGVGTNSFRTFRLK